MIYQGPCVGSSKGNCCDRTQDIKNFETEFHRPSTMSSYEKLKGFKKEREHLLDLEVQFWSSNNKTTSVRREDRNKNKLFFFFFFFPIGMGLCSRSLFPALASVIQWPSELQQIWHRFPLYIPSETAHRWLLTEGDMSYRFPDPSCDYFTSYTWLSVKAFLPEASSVASQGKEEFLPSLQRVNLSLLWHRIQTENQTNRRKNCHGWKKATKKCNESFYTLPNWYFDSFELWEIWYLIQYIAFQNFTIKFTSKEVLALPV